MDDLSDKRTRAEAPGPVVREVDELAQALERRDLEDRTIDEICEDVAAGLFLDEILEAAYRGLRRVIPYDRIGCALLDEDGDTLRSIWARSSSSHVAIPVGYTASIRGSSLERLMTTRETRILNDLEDYLAKHPTSDNTRLIVSEGMRSSLTCPLINRGKPVGFLFFSSTTPGTYVEGHKRILSRIAWQISAVIEKSRLYEQLYAANRQLAAARDELMLKAAHDQLTGLWNRGAIIEVLEKQVDRARRERARMGVIMADVDHFKLINDSYGHQVGDEVLCEVARRVRSQMRASEFAGRYGGEEFVLLAYGCNDISPLAERVRRAIAATPVATEAGPLQVTISLGAVIFDGSERRDAIQMLQRADMALYRAKNAGRNRTEIDKLDLAAG